MKKIIVSGIIASVVFGCSIANATNWNHKNAVEMVSNQYAHGALCNKQTDLNFLLKVLETEEEIEMQLGSQAKESIKAEAIARAKKIAAGVIMKNDSDKFCELSTNYFKAWDELDNLFVKK